MSILKHQIILHSDIVGQFSLDKPVTAYKHQLGFSWYLCPVTVADKPEWLLVNVEFGYCQLVIAPEKTPIYIGDAAITVIENHLPEARDDDNVSVSLSGDDISWHTANKMPEHVTKRYQQAVALLRSCKDLNDADDALDGLNDLPLTIGGKVFAPVEGLEGLLLELADDYRSYIESTPWWKLQWHIWTRKEAPWIKAPNRNTP